MIVTQYMFSVLVLTIWIPRGWSFNYDPCCSHPCRHGGICTRETETDYACECTKTGYYGKDCHIPEWKTQILLWIKPSNDKFSRLLISDSFLWRTVNNVDFLRKFIMKLVIKIRTAFIAKPVTLASMSSYIAWDAYSNTSQLARALPPIPLNCPTPMGDKGPKVLPDPELVLNKLFLRDKFEPCPVRTSLVLPFFAQHFYQQFYKHVLHKDALPSNHQSHIDMSHVYGQDPSRKLKLRELKDGKMKYQVIKGEVYPPDVKTTDVFMEGTDGESLTDHFALGHSKSSTSSVHLFFATLWLREHNRVCDIIKEENPTWNDERIFQTARLVIIGECLKIVVEDFAQHVSGFHYQLLYDPIILHDLIFSFQNRLHSEFLLLIQTWQSLLPDVIQLNDDVFSIDKWSFKKSIETGTGMVAIATNLTNQFAGRTGSKNFGSGAAKVVKEALLEGRRMRLQPYNKYREMYKMKTFKSFYELTGDKKLAADLEKMYGDIDAVEYFVGMAVEKRRDLPQMFGRFITEVAATHILQLVMSNPVGSPDWWKPSTFGGQRLFEVITSTSLQTLVCRNIKGCPYVSFKVPDEINYPFAPKNERKNPTINKDEIEKEKQASDDVDNRSKKEGIGSNSFKESETYNNDEL